MRRSAERSGSIRRENGNADGRVPLDKNEGVVKTDFSWAVRQHRFFVLPPERGLRNQGLSLAQARCGGDCFVPPTIDTASHYDHDYFCEHPAAGPVRKGNGSLTTDHGKTAPGGMPELYAYCASCRRESTAEGGGAHAVTLSVPRGTGSE